jgi:hypothetical protein
VVNPRRKRKRNKLRRRRRMTPKQIRFFGTKRQKAALKRKRATTHRKRVTNPKRRVAAHRRSATSAHRKRKKALKRRRSRNPVLVVTLGAVNPKRRKSMARPKKKRRRNPKRVYRRRRNRTRVVVMAPRRRRRRNPKRHYAKHHRRRNPAVFGARKTSDIAKMVLAGLVGVAAAKFLPTVLPAQFVSSNLMRTIATGVSAWIAGFVAGKVGLGKEVGDAVMFGGFMQTGSVALNAFLPSIGRQIGLGELMPGQFPVPQNPLRIPAPAVPAQARINMSGLARSFGSAF